MPLPISVIVPHLKSRIEFFEQRCLPSIKAQDPAEIFIENGPGNACEKRNAGAMRATQPYLLFVDDDSVLRLGAASAFLQALEGAPQASFAYSDLEVVLYPGVYYPNPAGRRNARPWDPVALRAGNYIDTTSLLRREAFPGFDPEILRFQDWDLWLTLAGRGHFGVYIPETLVELHHFDRGITASVPFTPSLEAIRRKHRL